MVPDRYHAVALQVRIYMIDSTTQGCSERMKGRETDEQDSEFQH